MTEVELWAPDELFGKPTRVGYWLYAGVQPLAVRVFRSDVRFGSCDEHDPPEYRDDQAIECYYVEFQESREDKWCSRRDYLTLEEIDRFFHDQLKSTVHWQETPQPPAVDPIAPLTY